MQRVQPPPAKDRPLERLLVSDRQRAHPGDDARVPAQQPPGPTTVGPGADDSLDRMAARQHVSIDLDADVAAILRAHAAEAHLSEGEIIDRAIRAYDLRALLAQIRERSDLGEDQALALAREELHAARAERDTAA
jgi:hypothetical protein